MKDAYKIGLSQRRTTVNEVSITMNQINDGRKTSALNRHFL